MADLFLGKPVSDHILLRVETAVAAMAQRPMLATLRVGDRADDVAYERSLERRCQQASVRFRSHVLPDAASEDEIITALCALNDDDAVDGILLFQPLPAQPIKDMSRIRNAILPEKDVDAITDASLGGLLLHQRNAFAPCTAEACMEILRYYQIPLSGAEAVVVGRSLVVGRPLAAMLLAENATVTVCHTRTQDLPAVCRRADILIAAAGKPRLIGAAHVRPDQIIVDVGIHTLPDGRLCGDVNAEEVMPVVRALTPVPRGVGSVTTAVLLQHVCSAAKSRKDKKL